MRIFAQMDKMTIGYNINLRNISDYSTVMCNDFVEFQLEQLTDLDISFVMNIWQIKRDFPLSSMAGVNNHIKDTHSCIRYTVLLCTFR
jgi:hypothetical protein